MAGDDRRPLIAVTGPDRGARGPRLCIALGLRLAGARPIQLSPSDPECPGDCDGVVISGGHDVEPVLYAAASEVEAKYDRERDAFESGMIDHALERGLPLLGICRGAQLLNVRLGGSLHQDLRRIRKLTSNRRTIFPLKTLLVEEGSYLHALLGTERTRINSLHKQSIDHIGRGLTVAGRDLDGIVQAVEDRDRPYRVGVQWHPEFLLYSRRQRALFRALVDAARAHRASGN